MCRKVCLSRFACGHEEQQTLWPCGQSEHGSSRGNGTPWFVKACDEPDRVVMQPEARGHAWVLDHPLVAEGDMLSFVWPFFCAICTKRAVDALLPSGITWYQSDLPAADALSKYQ